MAYRMTAEEFFDGPLSQYLQQPSPLRELGGVVEVTIEGEQGGTWSIDLTTGRVRREAASAPVCIIRADALDFMALVEGRMSVADGLITERLSVTGDISRLTRLFAALESRPSR